MKYETARCKARIRALGHVRYTITSESQTDAAWVFLLGDPSGESVTANLPMFVYDKEGGMASARLDSLQKRGLRSLMRRDRYRIGALGSVDLTDNQA